MKARIVSAFLVGLVLTGCEQASQDLPFTVDDIVGQTIAPAGGTVSTPAGASVEFPTGSVTSSVAVTVEVVPTPVETRASGAAVSESYRLEPAGLELAHPALAELKFSDASDRTRGWLASVISVENGRVVEHGDTRVELKTGLAATEITRLATLSVVIPPADAIVPVVRTGTASPRRAPRASALAPVGTDSVVLRCGTPDNRCTGLVATASDNLMDRVDDAAAVYPAVNGGLRINGAQASDSLVLTTSVRARLQSGQTAENVVLHALVKPTAGTVVTETATEIRLTNVLFRVSGASESEGSGTAEETSTLVISKGAAGGTVTVSRTFELRNDDGRLQDATVSVSFPVHIYQ